MPLKVMNLNDIVAGRQAGETNKFMENMVLLTRSLCEYPHVKQQVSRTRLNCPKIDFLSLLRTQMFPITTMVKPPPSSIMAQLSCKASRGRRRKQQEVVYST